jgi:hypothetical protein
MAAQWRYPRSSKEIEESVISGYQRILAMKA